MRRSDHPSRPSAITCSRFSALKTLAIPAAGAKPTTHVNVSAPGAALAGFQVSINGRFWVSTEGLRTDWHHHWRWTNLMEGMEERFGLVDAAGHPVALWCGLRRRLLRL